MKAWTTDEEKLIKEHYTNVDGLAHRLGRSTSSVKHKIYRMGLVQPVIRDWNADEDNHLREIYADLRITNDQLIKIFNRPIGAIQTRAGRLGVGRKKWHAHEDKVLADHYNKKPITDFISLLPGRTDQAIQARAFQLGLTLPPKVWTEQEDDILRRTYCVAAKEEILEKLPGRNWQCVISRATTLKVGSRRASGLAHRKYTFDFNYFEVIDTQEKAYWLGFIYADGSLSKIGNSGSLDIKLISEAKPHLEKFVKCINYDGPIHGPDSEDAYDVCLSHPKLIADLINKGVVPRKTWCVRYPDIPKELNRHFIRGWFDGDGTTGEKLTRYKDKVYTSGVFGGCGAVPEFLQQVMDILCEEVGVEPVVIAKRKKSNTRSISWQGTPALRIRDYIYDGATVWMEYKKQIFFSHDYSMLRPQDKQHQEQIIDGLALERGWIRLSEYNGYYEDMTFQCDKGHIYTTSVCMFKLEKGCPKCMAVASGERMTELGKENIAEVFAKRGWKLLSEYVSEGEVQIQCEHGKVFTMKRRSATRPHAQCDCVRTNSLDHGKRRLLKVLETKKWKLLSDYTGFWGYVDLRCTHGKIFRRSAGNIKAKSKCDCDKLAGSGQRGVYKQPSGRWSAVVRMDGEDIRLGTFATTVEAANAREKYISQFSKKEVV